MKCATKYIKIYHNKKRNTKNLKKVYSKSRYKFHPMVYKSRTTSVNTVYFLQNIFITVFYTILYFILYNTLC